MHGELLESLVSGVRYSDPMTDMAIIRSLSLSSSFNGRGPEDSSIESSNTLFGCPEAWRI
jgi:hypothetical protein